MPTGAVHIFSKTSKKGFSQFMRLSTLPNYLRNDTLIMKVKLELVGKYNIDETKHFSNNNIPIKAESICMELQSAFQKASQQVEGRLKFMDERQKEFEERETKMKELEDRMDKMTNTVPNKVILDVGMLKRSKSIKE